MDNCSLEMQRETAREPYWRALADKVGGEVGERLVEAIKDLYSIYSPDVIDWFASLYDVKTGGYYYSASARDNDSREHKGKTVLLLPDLESTWQALEFIITRGMINDFDRKLAKALPTWMQDDIANWTINMQDEDGYFYHKQWGKNIGLSRRGRDLSWGNLILDKFGREKKYISISDGEKVKESTTITIPEHLQSKENFAEYLESKNINEGVNSYVLGNALISQQAAIKQAGRMEQCIEFLNAHQLDNGLWHEEENYGSINGAMKITCVYNAANVIIPRAKKIARSAIRVLLSGESVEAAVDLFNPWFAISNLLRSLRDCGDDGNREADEILAEVRAAAPEAILATKRKVLVFKKESGSFSYLIDSSAPNSQGMPVALENSWEGDINGYLLSASGLISQIYRALELTACKVPLFTRCDFDRYIKILEAKKNYNEKKS